MISFLTPFFMLIYTTCKSLLYKLHTYTRYLVYSVGWPGVAIFDPSHHFSGAYSYPYFLAKLCVFQSHRFIIWAVFPSHNIFLLQLKKMRIFEPSGRVLLCLKNTKCLLIPKIQVWTHQDLKDPNFYIKV